MITKKNLKTDDRRPAVQDCESVRVDLDVVAELILEC